MPYTAKQRRYFHAQAAKGKPGMKKLAEEADAYAREGKEKKVAKKALPAKVTKKQMPSKEGASKRATPGAAKKATGSKMPPWLDKAPAAAKKAVAKKIAAKKRSY